MKVTPMKATNTILDRIVERKRLRVEAQKRDVPIGELKARLGDLPGLPASGDFAGSLVSKSGIALIAEIKKASPSKGIFREEFRERFPAAEIARTYEQNGASALSIITEQDFFLGCDEYVAEVRQAVSLPILRKDFIVDEYQLYESRVMGADAVLLIAGLSFGNSGNLRNGGLRSLLELARSVGLEALVEVHTREELDLSLEAGATVIGINNRDLTTFKTDLSVTLELSRRVPRSCILVSESGITSRTDMLRLESAGVRAALVGETLIRSADIASKVRELLGL